MSEKNKTVALILCVFLGYLGIHRFYVGKTKTGILYLLTCGLCGIGWIVDIILICTGKFSGGAAPQSTSTTQPARTQTPQSQAAPVTQPIQTQIAQPQIIPVSQSVQSQAAIIKELPKITDGQMLKYHSSEIIVLIGSKVEDVTCSEGEELTFVQHPQNKHDPNAILVCHQTKYQLGYMLRGQIQDLTNQWLNNHGLIIGFISEINEKYDRISFEIGFYKPISEFQRQIFKLEKIRQENMEGYISGTPTTVRLYRGQYAVFYGKTRLGEISNAESFMQNTVDAVGILTNVNCNDGKYTAEIEVYI